MAPVIIEISDEEPSTAGARARPDRQPGVSNKRKSTPASSSKLNLPSANRNNLQQSQDGFSGQQNTNGTDSAKSGSPHAKVISASQPQRFLNGAKRPSNSNKSSSQPSSKRKSETIVLSGSEDEAPSLSKTFIRPRGLKPGSRINSQASSPTPRARPRSSSGMNGLDHRKRPRETDSPTLSLNSTKRLKVDITEIRERSSPGSQNRLPNSAGRSVSTQKQLPKFSPSARRSREQVDLRTPTRLEERNDNTESANNEPTSASQGQPTPTGTDRQQIGHVRTPTPSERKPKSPRLDISPSPSNRQRRPSATPQPGSGRSKEVALREQRSPRRKQPPAREEAASGGNVEPEGNSEHEANYAGVSATPCSDLRGDNDVSGKQKVPQIAIDAADSNQPSLRTKERETPKSDSVHETDKSTSDQSATISNLTRLSHLKVAQHTPSRNPSTKSYSEEDQGYGSLSSGNESDSRAKHGEEQTSQGAESAENAAMRASDGGITAEEGMTTSRNNQERPLVMEQDPGDDLITQAREADLQLRLEDMQHNGHEREAMPVPIDDFARPMATASPSKAASWYSRLPLANRIEKILGGHIQDLGADHEYWTAMNMKRARLSKEGKQAATAGQVPIEGPSELTSFRSLKPLNFSPSRKGSPSAKSNSGNWDVQRLDTNSRTLPKVTALSAPYARFAIASEDVPNYSHYVSLKHNVLAPNVVHLHCWPFLENDMDHFPTETFEEHYKIDVAERERKINLLLQAQKYEEYVEGALNDLECSWADVLRFLLAQNPDVGTDSDAKTAYEHRPQYCKEDFNRGSSRWITVLESLPPSTPERLGRAAVLCETFLKLAKFSIWHVARRSHWADLPKDIKALDSAQPADGKFTCRTCLRFECPYHGQHNQQADGHENENDSDDLSLFSVDNAVATDIVHPFKVNYRSRVAFPPIPGPTFDAVEDRHLKRKQRDSAYWTGYQHAAENRGPFYPCWHPGSSCESSKCSCFTNSIPCEKTCSCPSDCSHKFKGCSCRLKKGQNAVCFESAECVCWSLGRECDPDLCGSCGVCEVADPVNKYDDRILVGRCRNANIQRGLPKHTILGDSGVHGLGMYACEDLRENDFVGEYKGEIVTNEEAERRGAIYQHQKLSYLFSLNNAQAIDGTYFGNKTRFINHANKANLYPKIVMVNTVHRIALYAARDIPVGRELLFNYGDQFPDVQLQDKKSKKSVPHVHNANLVKYFDDVHESEDEAGNMRAKAVSRTNGAKGKARGKKARNGLQAGGRTKSAPDDHVTITDPPERTGERDVEPDAGERLAAFNISEDAVSSAVEHDAESGAGDDDAFEPNDSESVDTSETSEESEASGLESEDDLDGGRVRARGGNNHKRSGFRA